MYKTLKAASPFPPILLHRDEHGHGWLWNGYGWRLEQLGLGWRMGPEPWFAAASPGDFPWIFRGFSWMARLSKLRAWREVDVCAWEFQRSNALCFWMQNCLENRRKSWGSPAKNWGGKGKGLPDMFTNKFGEKTKKSLRSNGPIQTDPDIHAGGMGKKGWSDGWEGDDRPQALVTSEGHHLLKWW